MSEKHPILPVSPIRLLLLQFFVLGVAAAYPYLLLPTSSDVGSRRLVKRAFDRFDNSGVFAFGAKRFDDFQDDSYGYGYPDGSQIFKRSVDPSRFVTVPSKKAFDRMDGGVDFFGAKRKRAFDRLGGTEFGLVKRSTGDREKLIDNLTESIIALRKSRAAEGGSQPVVVTYDD
uniref:Uncharacterized protein n=1 Tax=Caenorhabditis japonica TaxID=281687 RepID=A0A8R1DSQ2_CAEJA